jgi:hypothetical protein
MRSRHVVEMVAMEYEVVTLKREINKDKYGFDWLVPGLHHPTMN